jgi:acid phosphatase family membrane protein YuiD
MEQLSAHIVNTGLEALTAGLFSAVIAQALKLMFDTIIHKRIDFRVLTTTGGMPSSHSAGVVALSTTVGIISGFTSLIFAVSLGYSFVVMYDAAGIRRASGKMAVCLNKMMGDFYKHDINAAGTKLKELLGHTPKEVFCGALLGVAFAFWYHYIFLL